MLLISGMGVLVFGAWSVLKTFLIAFFSNKSGVTPAEDAEISEMAYYLVLGIILIIFDVFILWLHFQVGISAMREARGKSFKKRRLLTAFMFILALIDAVLSVFALAISIEKLTRDIEVVEQEDTTIASFFVSFTFLYVMLQLLYSRNKCRKLQKEIASKEAA